MSYKASIIAAAAIAILVAGGALYTNKAADAVSTQGQLNKLYSEWQKTGDVDSYYYMCALAMNSVPDEVPNKVADACANGL